MSRANRLKSADVPLCRKCKYRQISNDKGDNKQSTISRVFQTYLKQRSSSFSCKHFCEHPVIMKLPKGLNFVCRECLMPYICVST